MYVNFSLSANVIAALNNSVPTGNGNNPPTVIAPTGNQPTAPIINMKTLADDDPALGDANAKVIIVAFEDYQCPFCGRFHQQTFPQIKSEYIDKGKVKFVFRDFPLGFHENAQKASEAAECAKEQGKYWEYSETLFSNQEILNLASLKSYAKQTGLNQAQFDSCLDSGKFTAEVQKDLADGSAIGVSGTPSFFINGQQLVGAQPFSVFKAAIDAALVT